MKLLTYLSFSILIFTLACKDDAAPQSDAPAPAAAFTPINRTYTKTDTVRFTGDSSRIAVIGLLTPGTVYLEDSSRKVPVDVLYFVKGKQVAAHTDTFNTRDEEELSYYFEGMDTSGNSCERFFTVNFGYPACGYNQSHLTFYATPTQCYFVTGHNSYADGAWGGGLEFYDVCSDAAKKELRSAIVNRGSEEDTGDVITISYSDSVLYTFDGTKWNAKAMTEKDKVYRTAKEQL